MTIFSIVRFILVAQSAENRRKSVTNSGYAYVKQWFWFPKFERQPQRK